jgi:tRNA-specific 2-thiouridylase
MSAAQTVFVAVSGGVDSAATAALLCQQGYHCSGVFMITHDGGQTAQADAEQVCRTLGIELHVLDFRREFDEIIGYFTSEYRQARTPNPCVLCNRLMKFGRLWQFAASQGADFIATGHYAQIRRINGTPGLYQAQDASKDQSYVLSMIRRDTLNHILLPMAELTKDKTRQLAAQFGLHIHSKADSQEICFIPDNDYAGLLRRLCPDIQRPGDVVDKNGTLLGRHEGIFQYTIGQRRGLRIAMGEPVYVVGLDSQTNTVILGPREELLSTGLTAAPMNWLIDIPLNPFKAMVKIRYNHQGSPATVYPETDSVRIVFDHPVSAVTPGQAAVIYIPTELGMQVAGGAWINNAFRE